MPEQKHAEGGSFTLAEWCAYRRISRAYFYVLESQGKAPRTYRIGVQLDAANQTAVLAQKCRKTDDRARWVGKEVCLRKIFISYLEGEKKVLVGAFLQSYLGGFLLTPPHVERT